MAKQNALGLIAGQGRLPFLVAAGAKKAGLKVICLGLAGNAEPELEKAVDRFYKVPLARPGKWIKRLKKHGVTTTIMVGRVAKTRIYTPWRILRYLPDWRAFRIWYWRLRKKDKLTDHLLSAVADELETGGIILEDSTRYCKEHLASEGFMTSSAPGGAVKEDIEFGWPRVKKLADLDIGQAIIVKEREVIAVEAIEGTASMIQRVTDCCKTGYWTLLKAARSNQDNRFDVPCVGPETITSMAENGGKCLVLEAGKIIILDKPQTIELAEQLNIDILGLKIVDDLNQNE